MKSSHVTVEQTSKKFKLVKILTTLAVVVGIIWLICAKEARANGTEASYIKPFVTISIAFAVGLVNRFLIWWNHG